MTTSQISENISDVDQIVSNILALQKDGEQLPSERDLAEKLDVKRHQLRKALAVLRKNGDLRPIQARRAPTALAARYGEELVRLTNPLEILELRLIIEPGLARLASLRATSLESARITEAATTRDNEKAGAIDLAFHLAIAEAARNHLAEEFYKTMRQIAVDTRLQVANKVSVTCPKRVAQRDAEHQKVAQAIKLRDPEAAEAAMRAHILSVFQQVNQRINAGSGQN